MTDCFALISSSTVSSFMKDGRTALILAAKEGHLAIVSKLIEYGASTDTTDEVSTTSMLIFWDYLQLGPVWSTAGEHSCGCILLRVFSRLCLSQEQRGSNYAVNHDLGV